MVYVGGVDVSSQLIELGLVDEYHFVVTPILAGEGRRLLVGCEFTGAFTIEIGGLTYFQEVRLYCPSLLKTVTEISRGALLLSF